MLILGAGLAGIAAALRLSEHGVRVTVLETRRKLGGRATSFTDPRSGEVLDNCQHVMLGCCTNYADLLERLGVLEHIRWDREQHWLHPGGKVSRLRPGVLPAPLHYAGSMLTAGLLTQAQQRALARACLAILRADRSEHDHETFARYLTRLGQPPELVARFWEPIVVSACNLGSDRVSAAVALHVFQEGFLAHRDAGLIGVPTVPLVRLYDRALDMLGANVVLGAGVERFDDRRAVTSDGREFSADRVVCALPVERVLPAADPALVAGDPRFAPLARFTHSPILGVHLTFDRPVLATPHAALVERPTQWLFAKNASAPQTLHAVISAADDWMDLSEDEITQRVLGDIHACIPTAASARLLRSRAVKERRATFAPVPGLARLRPGAAPAPENPGGVILAGDYTDTGWPATMEGATRSGYIAAAIALNLPADALLTPDLQPSRLAHALATC